MDGVQQKTAGMGKRLARGLFLVLLVCPVYLQAAPEQGNAPLDTLRETSSLASGDAAGQQISIQDSSRRKLPDVRATVVPSERPPRRPPRLWHPLSGEWFFQQARLAERRGDDEAVKKNLDQALAIDPENSRYQWWQASQAVKNLDTPTLMSAVPKIIGTLLDSPVARGRLVVRLHQGGLLLVAWFWTLLVGAIYLSKWNYLAHDLGAMLFRDRNHSYRGWLPLLIPLLFLALRPGWLGFLALMSVPLLIQTRNWTRNLLAASWLTAILLVFPAWPFLHWAPPVIDPGSEVTLLDDACRLEPSRALIQRLDSTLKTAQDPERKSRLQVALAIQEARQGHFKTSDRLFKNALQQNPDNFPAQVGLANNTYYRGHLDQALARYQQAQDSHPDRGEIAYNMAQVYFKKLFIPEATTALEKSRTLGFLAPTLMDKRTQNQGYSPVVYPRLTNGDLLAACRLEAGNYAPLVTISTWQTTLGSPPLPLFLVLVVPLFLALVLILWWSHQADPRECKNCGRALCRDCCRVRDTAWLCPACGESASRSRSDVVLATLMKNRSRDEGMKHSQRIVALGRIIPGAGHLATGRLAAAWFRLSLATLGFFSLSAGWIFDSGAPWKSPGLLLMPETINPVWLPLPRAMWTGWLSLPVVIGLGALALVWIIGLLDGHDLRKGIPERFSWAPTPKTRTSGPVNHSQNLNNPQPMAAVGPGLRRP